MMYMILSLPTTFIIDANGDFYGYATGMMTKNQMKSSIEQALQTPRK
jgi:cytochrome c-type biogenesis protein